MRWLSLLLLLVWSGAQAQQTDYFAGMGLREGIYNDFLAFRNNRPSAPLAQLRDGQGAPVSDLRRVSGKLQWQPDSGASQTVDISLSKVYSKVKYQLPSAASTFVQVAVWSTWP